MITVQPQIILCSLILLSSTPAYSQINSDNTLGAESSRFTPNVVINGANADRIDGGAQRGSNLFHSFSEFNINDGQRVYFGNPVGVQNILTRVTGGQGSNILGTLGVDGIANLFLINPNGIVFGKNASLDVRGSFVGTTANAVQFGNQGIFSATNPQAAPLLTINPSALLFNQINSNAAIQNNSIAPAGQDPAGFDAFGLRVPDGKSLLLVGGNVSMDSGQLNAYGGRVELGGLAAPGNVNLVFNGDNLSLKFPENVARADVSLTNQAGVYVEAAGGGDIAINARNVGILGNSILSAGIGEGLGTPETVAGDITLNATVEIKVAGSGSRIFNFVREGAKGNAGNITIDSGSFSLEDGAKLQASTFGQGNAGNITVGAKNAVSLANAYILSAVEEGGVGKGGNIDINAATLSLTDGAQLVTVIRDASATQPAGRGDAGNVNVKVTGAVDIAGMKNGFSSAILSDVLTGTVGNGGNITIDSGSFSLRDGAQLSASTLGQGNAGNVTVNAKDAVSLGGDAGILSAVEAGGEGKGGNIDINAATLSLTDGAQLVTVTSGASDTQAAGRGDAGNVKVNVTGVVDIAGVKNGFPSGIFSLVDTGTVGNGGNITIDSGSFSLRDGAKLQASTLGQGNAGNVNVKVTGAVDIAGVKNGFSSGIFSFVYTGTVGNGGNINISSGSFFLSDGAQLAASTLGQGNAGNVTVSAKDAVSLAGNATIFSTVEAGGVGKGGNIDINAATLSLTDGAQLGTITRRASATQPAGKGDAGNVNVKVTGEVNIAGVKNGFSSGFVSAVDTGAVGNGGNITIDSGSFSLRDGAELQASTFGQGNAGNIRINAKDGVTVSGTSQESGFSSALFTFTNLNSTGVGSDITVNTNIFRVSDGALLDARTGGNRNGGNITVNANIFEALNGGQIITTTSGNGSAGKITVNATDKVIISGSDSNYNDRSAKFPSRVRNIGANSGFFVSSTASGITGDIEVNSPKITLDNQGKLNADSTSGSGGNINVSSDLLLLRRNSQISTNAGTEEQGGDGGNININSKFIVAVPNENSDILANAFTGKGGNININTQAIFGIEPRPKPTNQSDITASSDLGVQGQITITQPQVQPPQKLIELPTGLVDATTKFAQTCPRDHNAKPLSSFVVTGRGSLPPNFFEPLSGTTSLSPLASLDGESFTNVSNVSPTVNIPPTSQIVEAQGWVKTPDGNIALVAEAPTATPAATSSSAMCPGN